LVTGGSRDVTEKGEIFLPRNTLINTQLRNGLEKSGDRGYKRGPGVDQSLQAQSICCIL
jgi:hypothetical protein